MLEIFKHLANTGAYLTVLETLYHQGFLNCSFAYGKYKRRILQHNLILLLYTLYNVFFLCWFKEICTFPLFFTQ